LPRDDPGAQALAELPNDDVVAEDQPVGGLEILIDLVGVAVVAQEHGGADAQRQGSRMPRKAAVSAGRDRVTVRRPISIEKTLIRRRLIVEREIGASDRARTGDIQNHNLAL
jgi:hypothetical protein